MCFACVNCISIWAISKEHLTLLSVCVNSIDRKSAVRAVIAVQILEKQHLCLFLLRSQTPQKCCSQWNSKLQCQNILSLRPSGTQTDRIPFGQKFAPAWAEPCGFLPEGSESWRLRGSLCSLISLPQDTWRRHMLMRTNSPAARVIRGREFYLNFGACSNIQHKALCVHIFGLHHHHLGLNMRLSGSWMVSWLPSLFATTLCWVYFHKCVF